MKESVPCSQCGGQREHDLRTGEVLACDVCGERLCEACGAGNHWRCVGHFCECKATECRRIRDTHVICPGCKEGRHKECLGHRCHCIHCLWQDPDCPECWRARIAALDRCILGGEEIHVGIL